MVVGALKTLKILPLYMSTVEFGLSLKFHNSFGLLLMGPPRCDRVRLFSS